MPLLFNYLKIPDCFIDCKEFQLILQMIAMNNDLPAIRNKNYSRQKPFETDFLTVISNVKLRPSFFIC